MYLVAGLGNPGAKYEGTKHNMGFDVISELADAWHIPSSGISMKGMYGTGRIGAEKVILLKPVTYMNLSGEAVQAFVRYYKLDPETQLIVVYDDIDLEPGKIRIREKGSAGSHNGMKSVISCLGTNRFVRVRVGIGAKPPRWDLADYVLAPFDRESRELADAGVRDAAKAVEMIIGGQTDRAMNLYNQRGS
ncbi:MAG: aminoacyl-tRNA hydrolase [Eubacterium sp.]|jgi:PTH1 family peptidyl-tRNA hydrolase|nr:aminoacyl-tRNA hydrolase [Eubacterium sp.]